MKKSVKTTSDWYSGNMTFFAIALVTAYDG